MEQSQLIFELLPNIGNFAKNITMKTTSVALGEYFENFISETIKAGRYNNASEVVRAGLRMLEENERKIISLRSAINDGESSGRAESFNPEKHLQTLKLKRNA